METRTYNVYKYDELTQEQQEKVLENYRDINVDTDHWHEFLLEDWEHKLEEMGFIEPKISYTGFWSQGDGASFTCKDIDLAKYLKSQKLSNKYRMVYANAENMSGAVTRTGYHYYHERTISVELDSSGMGYSYDDLPMTKQNKLDSQLERLERHLAEHVVELSQAIYRELEQMHDDLTTDDEVKETLLANDYDFTTDGRIA